MAALTFPSAALFVAIWIVSRHRRSSALISDVFVIAFMIIYFPFFLMNTSADMKLNTPPFQEAVVYRSVLGMITFMGGGAIIFATRRVFSRSAPSLLIDVSDVFLSRSGAIALVMSLVLFGALMTTSTFQAFRLHTLWWISGELSAGQYAYLRRINSGPFLDGVIGRLRFSLMPILFLFCIAPLCQRGSVIRTSMVAAGFFVALPLSLSKLPFIYYVGYLVLLAVLLRLEEPLTIKKTVVFAIVGAAGAPIMIAALYLVQYKGAVGYQSIYDEPIRLAVDRIWGESYSVVLRYFATYPDRLDYSGWSGFDWISKMMGLGFRNPDIEVAQTILGPDSGSNPGIFFLAGYAAFGFPGVAAFSVLGFSVLWILDEIGDLFRTRICHQIYFAIMSLNVLFLLQIALQTTLFSYGLAIVPPIMLILDRIMVRYVVRL